MIEKIIWKKSEKCYLFLIHKGKRSAMIMYLLFGEIR